MEDKQQTKREEILAYYEKRATTSRYATSPDFQLREIEIEYLGRWLRDGAKVLDVGCGNGYSTLCHAAAFESEFVGIDFVPSMIEAARQLSSQFQLKGRADFQVGDVTNLKFPNLCFDIVISERCLLNLPSREDQWKAMRHIARVLKPGGLYLMLEGTLQGLRKLNDLRANVGLPPIPEASPDYNWFSNKFDEEEMLAVASTLFAKVQSIQRFGTYYFISRVIHPLLVAPAEPQYDAKINAVARQICGHIPNFGDLGHVALFILKR